MNPSSLVKELQCNRNLYLISNHGNKILWFSTDLPTGLPVGTKKRVMARENVPLPYGHFRAISGGVSGWMSYWQHFGGNCYSATAFVSISPGDMKRSGLEVLLCESTHPVEVGEDLYRFGLLEEYQSPFCTGILTGLQTLLSHPVAGVRVEVLNAIEHAVDSTMKGFEFLGQWLTEALIIEMCRRDFIERF